ncbi:hypothetical protein IMX26_14870 [Clostridium sp. 'deep sea']|uniref:AIR synthase related protein n=1 Tax=Clostridium sp. 'deep sea' TaxID=2779445 RepID=UPI001896506F|nr:AIR synthase related protein [Clostridium sp. 'deep sea']QOR34734.1 hypothetical protein IMX26_14870 [Clostridium sp. 'deep sea']
MKYRDALVTESSSKTLIITADNSVSIGNKEHDYIKVDPKLVGALTARVALLEAVCLNAQPIAVSCTLSFPFDSADAQNIMTGIKSEMLNYSLTEQQLTGSCESNFPATVTAIGITVISELLNEPLINKTKLNDKIFVIGKPLVGPEVVQHKSLLPTVNTIKKLQSLKNIHEIIPCGSGGVNSELKQATLNNDCHIELVNTELDLNKSAGPATCLIVVGDIELQHLQSAINNKITLIGYVRSKNEKEY